MALLTDGYLSQEEVDLLPGVPSKERLAIGPVVVVECAQEIPCNPCVDACNKGALHIEGSITNLPVLDEDKCSGCGLCISICPGQAIFVIDATFSENECSIQMPYEYLPLPKIGEFVDGLNRAGQAVCLGEVRRVLNPKKFDHTPVITLIVPKEFVMVVRSLKPRNK
ncbi:MAG: 4Fe-4S binding protein [Anaerolineaceae bacterium]|nr:4Fe-4S binding protein [Anaerolineaceae bacterium]